MNMGKGLYPPISEVMASMTLSLNAADKKIKVLQEKALRGHENLSEAMVEIEYLKNRNKQLESEIAATATSREELQRDYRRAQLDFVKSSDESTDRFLKLVQEHEKTVKLNLSLQEALAGRDESIEVYGRQIDNQSKTLYELQKQNQELKLQVAWPVKTEDKSRGQRDEMMQERDVLKRLYDERRDVIAELQKQIKDMQIHTASVSIDNENLAVVRNQRDYARKERDEARSHRDSLKRNLDYAVAKLDRIGETLQGRFVQPEVEPDHSWCGDEDPRG